MDRALARFISPVRLGPRFQEYPERFRALCPDRNVQRRLFLAAWYVHIRTARQEANEEFRFMDCSVQGRVIALPPWRWGPRPPQGASQSPPHSFHCAPPK